MLWLQNGHSASERNTSSRLIDCRGCLYSDGRMDGWMEAADTDSTHLNTEDFKGSDGIHQAVDDFVRL